MSEHSLVERFMSFCESINEFASQGASVETRLFGSGSSQNLWSNRIVLAAGLLCVASIFTIGTLCSLIVFEPGNSVQNIMIVFCAMFGFSVLVRPPCCERDQGCGSCDLVSPITITYFLLMLLMSLVWIASMAVMSSMALPNILIFVVMIMLLQPIVIMSLANFEREQVRLSLSRDEKDRQKAILMSGRLVFDGVPKGYVVSTLGLVIIAVSGVSDVWKKIRKLIMDQRPAPIDQ